MRGKVIELYLAQRFSSISSAVRRLWCRYTMPHACSKRGEQKLVLTLRITVDRLTAPNILGWKIPPKLLLTPYPPVYSAWELGSYQAETAATTRFSTFKASYFTASPSLHTSSPRKLPPSLPGISPKEREKTMGPVIPTFCYHFFRNKIKSQTFRQLE